ncbi:CRISPR-associated helicase Cas3' [Streptomyces sp. DSM 44917]|uniref:CRISPR-associated helicase Cas3 n=1 Tax=Streptomyces boetiae TaxID=3075541 RepID=A0ABU2LFU2_9ACTN|nr:CRISPR-associated helicase Cas3' [Streptomyces sp. DSM 44917]MDT0310454.1 CRISPR-associated helicase Cas3' [Streptomyces sp. DSM 44917]
MAEGVDVDSMLGALWGKSEEKGGGRKTLLLSHLLDTAAVAEALWDGFLADSTKRVLDAVAGGAGRGRAFFAWVCGIHDCGKATPAFQRLWEKGAEAVRAAGLGWHEGAIVRLRWRHDVAGGHLLRKQLTAAGWAEEHVEWLWPLIAGHHGLFPRAGSLPPSDRARGQLAGTGQWPRVQRALVERFTAEVGFGGLAEVEPVLVPSRAAQLHLSGLIVMADWIASDEEHFPGLDALEDVSFANARVRARRAWKELGLRGGWNGLREPGPEDFAERFGTRPRPSQVMVMEAARRMRAPGLLVVEAPMGEGKTKAALMAAEILAARFGADGVFVGMPTQATSDPMFTQVRQWTERVEEGLASQVALLHGKRMFNKEWRALTEGSAQDAASRFGGVDEYGDCWEDDPFGSGVSALRERTAEPASRGPAEWFLGPKRGLLCPFVVGTIDQLLFAATRTKHVMLRMAGLVGKVVVLDEVHAADVYMSQFLKEGLRWLGQAGVPVVLLSATLPPEQRRALVSAYLAGASSREEYPAAELPEPHGYPSVTAAWTTPADATARVLVDDCPSWREDAAVGLELLPEALPRVNAKRQARRAAQAAADEGVVSLLKRELVDGGCALVIRNTVGRAQSLYSALRGAFGDDVRLLHGRIAVAPRADRTEECLRLLGPGGTQHDEPTRASRLIIVATQLAEQSFDVDADFLVTDLAPIDLLLQRIGRLHRHAGVARPTRLAVPRAVITGFGRSGTGTGDEGAAANALHGAPPAFLAASEKIYGRALLLRAAALVRAGAAAKGWRVPAQVPGLVAAGYALGEDGFVPVEWREAERFAREAWEKEQQERADSASPFLLTRRGDREGATLAGLHFLSSSAGEDETKLQAAVRDGDPSAEVVLIVRAGGVYRTLSGRALSVNGDVPDGVLDEVLGGTVRLPPRYTEAVREELRPLSGWLGDPRLSRSPALVLDADRRAVLAERGLRYDDALGLVEEDPGA